MTHQAAAPADPAGATILQFPERKITPDMAALREFLADVEDNDPAEYVAIAQMCLRGLEKHQERKTGDLQGIVNCVAFAFFTLGLALEYFTLEDLA